MCIPSCFYLQVINTITYPNSLRHVAKVTIKTKNRNGIRNVYEAANFILPLLQLTWNVVFIKLRKHCKLIYEILVSRSNGWIRKTYRVITFQELDCILDAKQLPVPLLREKLSLSLLRWWKAFHKVHYYFLSAWSSSSFCLAQSGIRCLLCKVLELIIVLFKENNNWK